MLCVALSNRVLYNIQLSRPCPFQKIFASQFTSTVTQT